MSSVHIFDEVFEDLPTRVRNSLKKSDYDSLEELHELSDKELINISGVTKSSVGPIRGLLAAQGFEKEFEYEEIDAAWVPRSFLRLQTDQHLEWRLCASLRSPHPWVGGGGFRKPATPHRTWS